MSTIYFQVRRTCGSHYQVKVDLDKREFQRGYYLAGPFSDRVELRTRKDADDLCLTLRYSGFVEVI